MIYISTCTETGVHTRNMQDERNEIGRATKTTTITIYKIASKNKRPTKK